MAVVSGKGDLYERRRGAGHGGRGGGPGTYGDAGGGLVYGNTNAPTLPGSGGCGDGSFANAYLGVSGYGGGLIRLEARDTVFVDGAITANGGKILPAQVGGGSGGAIFIACRAFTGTGLLSAMGANSAATTGGAGGGRIAVWKQVSATAGTALLAGAGVVPGVVIAEGPLDTFTGAVVVDGGTGYNPGDAGTIRYLDGRPRGTVLLLR